LVTSSLPPTGTGDAGDANVIGPRGISGGDLPEMDAAHLYADMKLFVCARDQLVDERHARNR